MRVCQFNFNNEVDTFTIHVEDDGRVSVPGENGQIMATYDSIDQLAEIYAQARDVKPENLKNWTLVENGDVFSFVLRAGTAGVSVSEVEEKLAEAFASLSGHFHPLDIARARVQILSDGNADLVEALAHCTEGDISREIYNAMAEEIEAPAEEVQEEEEEDNRSELEKYLDEMDETPGAVRCFAVLLGLDADATKEMIMETLRSRRMDGNIEVLRTTFQTTLRNAMDDGLGVETVTDAITVITQTAEKDDEMKNRILTTTKMAGRTHVNLALDIVGRKHIRHTAKRVSLEELAGMDLCVRNKNEGYLVEFSDTVDEELEAEAQEEEAQETLDRFADNYEYDDDDYDDDYDGYYEDDYDED